MFQADLGEFFFDFGVLVTLEFANGTTRDITAIFDAPALHADVGSYNVDTSDFQITARSSDVADLRYKVDSVIHAGKTYCVTETPRADGTGMSIVALGDPGR